MCSVKSPDEQNVGLANITVCHAPTEILLPVLHVRLLIEDLDKVEVAVVWHLQFVLLKLDVDLRDRQKHGRHVVKMVIPYDFPAGRMS